MSTEIKQIKTRTILVYNFEDRNEFDSFTESLNSENVLEFYSVPNTLFLFITFYDIEEAIKFYEEKSEEHLKYEFTISKNEIPKENEECTLKANQGSFIIPNK